MSGSSVGGRDLEPHQQSHYTGTVRAATSNGWDASLGASHGPSRSARILLRDRLCVTFPHLGRDRKTSHESTPALLGKPALEKSHAVNELLLHRGSSPHLTHLTIMLNGRPLTTAIADGLLISTPTGSTAYSLSSGGSIVHPLVKGIVVNTVCARSLSFRYVLPSTRPICLAAPPNKAVRATADERYQRVGLSFFPPLPRSGSRSLLALVAR